MKKLLIICAFLFTGICAQAQNINSGKDSTIGWELVKAAGNGQTGIAFMIIGGGLGTLAVLSSANAQVTTAPGLLIIGASAFVAIICELSAWQHIKKAGRATKGKWVQTK